jgi:hypothetical protein
MMTIISAHAPWRRSRPLSHSNHTRTGCTTLWALLGAAVLFTAQALLAKEAPSYISTTKGVFTIAAQGHIAPLVVSSKDFPGVRRILSHLQHDLLDVTSAVPQIFTDSLPSAQELVIIGTIGKSPIIDQLISSGKLKTDGVAGTWESFVIQVIEHPFPQVSRALVIAGSDKRGTIFGMYDLSAKIGVSPWEWWADVPPKKHTSLFVTSTRFIQPSPKVRYRGIFINDEAPALSGVAQEKFGGFNSRFYEHVFDLILRLKSNYLWPAMWGRSLFADDSLSAPLADEYGVVLGTSHHEPMMRSHVEWDQASKGPWNYEKNDSTLREFWRQGLRRMDSHESIVTIGMRGDGDMPMSQDANISLLERIVKDQRAIISEVTGKDPSLTPQLWALYKEVQEYFDKGMRVPDDVTLLLCDDNWGNIRKLPKLTDKPRTGGYGIYYHFDYVGGPRNYKWVNTNQISRVWEQMHLAYEYGVNTIWIVNVGDIKPMEFPTSFFLDYAWNPDAWPASRLPEYAEQWAAQQFDAKYAKDIADILTGYTTFNSRRKPELLSPSTYSLVDYQEAELAVNDYNALALKAQRIMDSLSLDEKGAFFELALHPVLACENLNELYAIVGRNRLCAAQGRASTNELAARARALYEKDSVLSFYYNHIMLEGKWNHMMDQTHIGYTSWQQPDKDTMPVVRTITVPAIADMGVAIEGSTSWWPADTAEAVLPTFDPLSPEHFYIEIFNRGSVPFKFTASPKMPWVRLTAYTDSVQLETRIWAMINWSKVPRGVHRVPIAISGPNKKTVLVYAVVRNDLPAAVLAGEGYAERNGYVSIEAQHYAKAISTSVVKWLTIPSLGRTLSGVTPMPVTAPAQTPQGSAPHLEYKILLATAGPISVKAYLSPTLDFHNTGGLHYAVSIDDAQPQIINMHAKMNWDKWVSDNIAVSASDHTVKTPGTHVLKFWMVDPGVVLQKIVVETGAVKPSYLGPPESTYRKAARSK